MKKITKRLKKNHWRNTRNDLKIPWKEIWSKTFVIIFPIMIVLLANNIVVRNEVFYSHYMSRTGIVKEIPYEIENHDLAETFGDFMIHKKTLFSLEENSEYKPQQVFNKEDRKVMKTIRKAFDIMLILAVISAFFVACMMVYFLKKGNKKLLYKSYKKSLISFAVMEFFNVIVLFIKPLRKEIFNKVFDMEFPPGDVLVQLFEAKLTVYYGYFQIIVSLIIVGIVHYLMHKFVASHKMFKGNR